MATVASKLSVEEFDKLYSGEKPYYEYWHGEAIQKSIPTWVHALLERILMNLLGKAGYEAGSELKLEIDPDFQPVPDVVGTRQPVEFPYPTRPLEVVIEILSEDDPMSRVLNKLRTYDRWGFEQVYLVDPMKRIVYRWRGNRLEEVDEFAGVSVAEIWSALDRVPR